jgi:hypothetical protein
MRSGPPIDDEEDYSLPVWAGVVPVRTEIGEPIKDQRLKEGIAGFEISRLQRKTSS